MDRRAAAAAEQLGAALGSVAASLLPSELSWLTAWEGAGRQAGAGERRLGLTG